MPIRRDGLTYDGLLADNCDTEPLTLCFASWHGYVCTLERHPANYPHVAGNGKVIVAMWWDSEGDTRA